MSDISARLTGDNSDFKRMLSESVAEGGKFAANITDKIGGKLTGMKDVSTAVATALGLNLGSIAENFARLFTGMSKDAEDAFKRIDELSTANADASIANMRARASEEVKYQLNLQKRESLLRKINDEHLGEVDAVGYVEDALLGQIAITEKIVDATKRKLAQEEMSKEVNAAEAEIIAYENKLRDAGIKTMQDGSEKERVARDALLNIEERLRLLKGDQLALEEVLTNLSLTKLDRTKAEEQLAETKLKILSDEKILQQELLEQQKQKNDVMEKQRDANDSLLSGAEQLKLLKGDEEALEAMIAENKRNGTNDAQQGVELAKVKVKILEAEKQVNKDNLEIAKLLLKGAANLTEEEKVRLQILTGQVKQKEIDAEIAGLTAKMLNGSITPAEKERLAVLIGQGAELKKQLADLADMNKEVKAFVLTLGSKGASYASQSTAALEGIRGRVSGQLDQVNQRNAMTSSNNRDPAVYSLQIELDNINRELNSRKAVGQYADRFGEDATRAKYGDSLTDKALRDMQDSTTRSATTLQSIEERLAASGLFPKK